MTPGKRASGWLVIALSFVATATFAQSAKAPDPLFQSVEPLEIRISGPISTLMRERSDEVDLPATASWRETDGRTVEVSIGLRARGNYRRNKKTCRFAPIRVDFKTSDVKGSVFHKQDKLKLVTHCRKLSNFEQSVLREYVAYRMLNVLTDISYRVRLLNVTYSDTDSEDRETRAYAFVIESKDRLSQRIGLPIVEVPGVEQAELDPGFTNLISVFQYMMGNTDFSPLAGAKGENCCHNTNLFGGDETALFAIPYDFDITGMVNAPYATPNPRFKLRSVRERRYRGRCAFNAHLPESLQAFRDKKEALYALVENEAVLTKSSKNGMRKFLRSFYKVIDNPKSLDRRIVTACVGPAG